MEEAARKTRSAFKGRSGRDSLEPPRTEGSVKDQLASRFLAELHAAFKQGQVSRDTEGHLRNVFRSIGWKAEPRKRSAQVDREIVRRAIRAQDLLRFGTRRLRRGSLIV
jgi:hypothetical protein